MLGRQIRVVMGTSQAIAKCSLSGMTKYTVYCAKASQPGRCGGLCGPNGILLENLKVGSHGLTTNSKFQ